jgi:hypothetical protein
MKNEYKHTNKRTGGGGQKEKIKGEGKKGEGRGGERVMKKGEEEKEEN